MAAGLELHGLKNRPLKREANSEICQIPTKKRKICSHHPEVVEEKLDSSHLSSNMEIDVYPGMYFSPARYQHSSFIFQLYQHLPTGTQLLPVVPAHLLKIIL